MDEGDWPAIRGRGTGVEALGEGELGGQRAGVPNRVSNVFLKKMSNFFSTELKT